MKLPIEIENSRVPVWLSYLAPIEIYAFSFGPFIWCRGIFSTRLRNHETIHWRQQLECLFVGQWILYALLWFCMLIKYRGNMRAAYRNVAFEREAYANDIDPHYLHGRKMYAWVGYIIKNDGEP
tara:strand:+ start:2393 stop:2764 length:372 start_codon:yes stop_codon:yes gene_type:complete